MLLGLLGLLLGLLGVTVAKFSLSQATLWRLNLQLKKPSYEALNCILNVRFALDKGYEPPSGKVCVEVDPLGFANTNEKGITGLWTLSEDKNDKKVIFSHQLMLSLLLTHSLCNLGWAMGVGFI